MNNIKEEIINTINSMPDDATFEEIINALYKKSPEYKDEKIKHE